MKYFFVAFLIFAILICTFVGAYFDYSVVPYSDKIYSYDFSNTASFGRTSWDAAASVLHLLDGAGDIVTNAVSGVFRSNNFPLQKFTFPVGYVIEVDGNPVEITTESYLVCGFYSNSDGSFTRAWGSRNGNIMSVLVKKCSDIFDITEGDTIQFTGYCKCRTWGIPLSRLFGYKDKIVMTTSEHTYVWYDTPCFEHCSTIRNIDEYNAFLAELN